ncbi:M15 family metallopeptidase [Gulosibacter sp. 10]|uniref:M15 family metallopeptidase n=1 Tax=Gulosibacter sp. 10 TaxID=1255570 RepID=UPI00097E7794|nr:M15 family metallopeptidase [Gulosibacter sp. 10]SJM54894.1 D-alanyl-D-alanine carboxypeptidase [Gulosibacter sp. 10]
MTADRESRRRSASSGEIAMLGISLVLVAGLVVGIGAVAGWGAEAQALTVVPSTASAAPEPTASEPPAEPTPTGTDPADAPEETPEETGEPGTVAGYDGPYDITTASSETVLVNKRVPLDPEDYAPEPLVRLTDIDVPSMNDHSLREDAAYAVKELFADAEAAGLMLDATSGYRDYALQTDLYYGYIDEMGQEAADETSARPGYSEHQTGLAIDISDPGEAPDCILAECFGETEAGQWLEEHAWEYGFILRYPEGLADVTGYEYEPWHFRFIGVEAAAAFHESGAATYEEFLGLDPAPDYE